MKTEASFISRQRKETIILDGTQISYASLYSGCGGLDQGFHDAGLKGVCAIDHDQAALNVLAKNIGTKTKCMDLATFGEQHLPLLEGADIIAAGPPCQGFSTAGPNNPDDKRNDHVWNVARIATLAKPKVVVIENVRGLLSAKNSKHFDKTVELLRGGGYSVSSSVYRLSDYGIAQRRVRVLILAVRSSAHISLQIPCQERRSIGDVLNGVHEACDFDPEPLLENSTDALIARKIAPGQKLSNVRSGLSSVHTWDIPEVFGAVSSHEVKLLETIVKLRRQNRTRDFGDADPVSLVDLTQFFGADTHDVVQALMQKGYLRRIEDLIDLRNTFNGKFRRLKWDDVSPTVDTRFGQPRYFLHPEQNRGLTVREAARIQSFCDTFKFDGTKTTKYRMIGNAVPPKFAKLVAGAISKSWAAM
ncbi:DNA cytosine methyltransferase [Roseinatronobacter bogoriensis]|uniref:DNA cytosine methyltransferase n=1 Tax=Roseinatronobacter bogoriensis TaxID=119542 RepID=UPI000A8CA786|nr:MULTISPECIES: DNA cytosine methyltransferase [Rhodobaca]MBB4209759.1 DNA (cytosine-5)-methyltransferase 1 [Rhodobaca bogoriensis DSM 18756]TDW33691.1 DNA (cytosine-5)-methyltransferase 1 [Rhodobaca barguzinensis]TDY66161.1 DNA (cytosine-5)-methyltransferase 1 [Rhodobaca bogoriensis DSM 18756]